MENTFWKIVDKVYILLLTIKKDEESRQFPINHIL